MKREETVARQQLRRLVCLSWPSNLCYPRLGHLNFVRLDGEGDIRCIYDGSGEGEISVVVHVAKEGSIVVGNWSAPEIGRKAKIGEQYCFGHRQDEYGRPHGLLMIFDPRSFDSLERLVSLTRDIASQQAARTVSVD